MQPAEIVGLRIRAPANAFSTASNWIFNFVVVMVTGPAFNNIGWRTYVGTWVSHTTLSSSGDMSVTSVRFPERLHHSYRVFLLPRDCWTLPGRCAPFALHIMGQLC